jgi:hypothetical protein
LVRISLEVAGHDRAIPEALYGRHDIGLLIDNCLSELQGPVDIVAELTQDFRVIQQGNDGFIPVRRWFERRVLFDLVEEACCLYDLQRIGGGGQNDRQERIRVKRYRAYQGFEIPGGQGRRIVIAYRLDLGAADC